MTWSGAGGISTIFKTSVIQYRQDRQKYPYLQYTLYITWNCQFI